MKFSTLNANFDTEKIADCPSITKLSRNCQSTVMQDLRVIGPGGTHMEFMEEKQDVIIEDEFGQIHEVCEDWIWQ